MRESSDIVNDLRSRSLADLLRAIAQIKVSVLLSAVGLFLTYTVFLHDLGASQQQNETAVSMDHHFDLNLPLSEHVDKPIALKDVYFRLPEDTAGDIDLYLMEPVDGNFPQPVGLAKLKGQATDPRHNVMWSPYIKDGLNGLISLIAPARAEEPFDWAGHENRRDFYERVSPSHVVQRYYSDGWVLEYRVDEKGFGLPNTLRWVQR